MQWSNQSRRQFLATSAATVGVALAQGCPVVGLADGGGKAGRVKTPRADMAALRRAVIDSPVCVGRHRAEVFTRVFQQTEGDSWVLRKAKAMREYFRTVALYVRDNDRLVGAVSEAPGAMPVMVELGIGENGIYTSENPSRKGYLSNQVSAEIRDYWKNRNMWGQYRTKMLGLKPLERAGEVPQTLEYKFISNQGHLSPGYRDLLSLGIAGLLRRARGGLDSADTPEKRAFLAAAVESLTGLGEWATRYAEFCAAEASRASEPGRAAELREMARIAGKIAQEPPATFREAMQLIWLAHQAVHIEGHGYSCTPDRIDQLLWPYFEADRKAGRIDEAETLRLIENFVLKMYDNTVWGPEHHLTQGLCLAGSTAEGVDQTNRLSWLFVEGATNLTLPEPLVWVRWHPAIDQKFFDFCLTRLAHSTCFPMFWNDKAIPPALMALGVAREDAFNYVAVGCNELAVPGQCYFNPVAHAGYLPAIEAVLTDGKGYARQWKWRNVAPPTNDLKSFDQFAGAVGAYLRRQIEQSYAREVKVLQAQIAWGCTPLTSCFFDGCIESGHDMAEGTKYNILSCGGIAFANAVDCLAAISEVVYDNRQATLAEVAQACAANFQGHERLRAKLQAAPKHGNDDPRVEEIIALVERLRDVPMKEICRDPRDGSRLGNCHVVRSGAVKGGLTTPATPDGRLAGTPLASSMAASVGCERSGPTAVLNSVCRLDSARSWQCGYQVNIRFHAGMIANAQQREKLRAMLNVYFDGGGQELQINVVDGSALRAAQKNPEQYRDLVVRVAGFSEFFVNLTPEMQEDIIARTEHE